MMRSLRTRDPGTPAIRESHQILRYYHPGAAARMLRPDSGSWIEGDQWAEVHVSGYNVIRHRRPIQSTYVERIDESWTELMTPHKPLRLKTYLMIAVMVI